MASEITCTFVGDEKNPVSVISVTLRQALGENFLDGDSECEDYASDSDEGSENILDKSCG